MHPQRRLAAISIVVAIAITFVPMPAVGETPATPVTRVSVDGQPLASQLRRMLDGLQSMGQPPRAEDRDRLMAAIKQADSLGLQRATDPLVVAVVTISPEERVSVVRGPSSLKIQQHGFTPAIVKVINQSASTSRLRVKSPQSGPVYAGSEAFSLERQKQAWLGKDQNKNQSTERFLQLAVHSKQPMTDRLSGLGVEYVLLVLSASQSGRREAVMHFDIGDDTADLEFRNQLPLLLDIKPAIPVQLSIADDDGAASIARLEIHDVQGRVYPPQPKRLAPDFFFQTQVYRRDGEFVWMPPGQYSVLSSRGPEYTVGKSRLVVDAEKPARLDIKLNRWINPNDFGFYSGDHHIHAAGCSHYTIPTQGVSPDDMFRQIQGEGLNVGCVLTWGPCFDFQRNFFKPIAEGYGDSQTLMKYDLEISGFGSQALGHVCLLNLQDQTYPGSEGGKDKGWPTWTTPVMRWAKEQGGVTGYAHSASGLHIDPESAAQWMISQLDSDQSGKLSMAEVAETLLPASFVDVDQDDDQQLSEAELIVANQKALTQLPNYAIPEMSGVGAMEICVSTVAGVCDFISAMDTARIQEWNTWYHLLNCGFSTKVSGETDFPCMSSRRVGQGRVYVQLGKDQTLDFTNWCEGIAKGNSYVSDGFAHLIEFSINGNSMSDGSVHLSSPATIQVSAEVAFAPAIPKGIPYGTVQTNGSDSVPQQSLVGDTIEMHDHRGDEFLSNVKRQVEIVVNGEVVDRREMNADGKRHRVVADVPIDQSSWVAIRHFPQLHSNPIDVIIGNQPIRASRRSAKWCISMTKRLWQNREHAISKSERKDARAAFEQTYVAFEKIAAESTQP